MGFLTWTCVDRLFIYPTRREVVLGLELAPQWYTGDDPTLERSLRAKLDFYLTFIREGKIEQYHPEAKGYTPWIEIGYEGTLQGDDLEIVARLQQEVLAKGIDVKLVSVERL